MSRKSILVWGKVMTTDYYGEWESIVVKKTDIPPNKKVEQIYHEYTVGKQVKHPRMVILKQGMYVQIKWPNKDVTLEKLVIKDGSGSAQVDMNNCPDHFDTRHLYVRGTQNGKKINIPISGMRVGVLL